MNSTTLLAAAVPGLEEVVASELRELGLRRLTVVEGGVVIALRPGASEDQLLATMLRCNLQLRTASRVLARLARFTAMHLDQLARPVAKIPWERYLLPGQTVDVDVTCRHSRLYHSGAVAERVAQAVHERLGRRPPVRGALPARARVVVRVVNNRITVSLDTSGEHLHKRGYRLIPGRAPLRENLAAACLRLAGWAPGHALLDPMCGSGTIVIEAALQALGRAPGLQRAFACESWPCMPPEQVARVRSQVSDVAPITNVAAVLGADRDADAVSAARRNAERAGVVDIITLTQQPLSATEAPAAAGLMLVNPPYGTRLGEVTALRDLYAAVGNLARRRLPGWRVAVLCPEPDLVAQTGLELSPVGAAFDHGGLTVTLYVTGEGLA